MPKSQQWTACRACGIRLTSAHAWRWTLTADEKAAGDVARHDGKGLCGKCAKREQRGGAKYAERSALIPCPHCQRPTMSWSQWSALDQAERDALKAAGIAARAVRDGTCSACYSAERANRTRAVVEDDLAYEGGWVVGRHGVLRPTHPRGAA